MQPRVLQRALLNTISVLPKRRIDSRLGKKLAADRNYKIVKEAQTVPGSRKPWHNSIKDVIGALRRANQDLHTGDPTGMAKKTFDAVYKAIDTDYRQGESQSNREKAREYRQGVTQPLAQQRRETSQNP